MKINSDGYDDVPLKFKKGERSQHAELKYGLVQRWYENEDVATLAEGTPDYDLVMIPKTLANVAEVTEFVEGLNRSDFSFWKNTQEVLLEHSPRKVFDVHIGIDGNETRPEWHWYVEDDNQYMIIDAIEIGHIIDWKTYLKKCGVTNMNEARTAYNDLRNLKLQSVGANRSHAWEVDTNGNWLQ